MDVEDALQEHLSSSLEVGAYRSVPRDRPAAFVVAERTGGPVEDVVTDRATFDVQAWGASERQARELAHAAREAVLSMPEDVDGCFGSTVTSLYNDPDPDSGTPRYRVVCEVTYQQ